ncbi:MAG TPA: transglutaminase family protein [Steroidobacteraceae bacterium]|jgi:transglutaminase-like putative cysteine protease|nr:transglutaminase family protein [Steroidobacteraceae bacterium]
MYIRFGYDLLYSTSTPTHMILMLHPHLGRDQKYVVADKMQLSRPVPQRLYTDGFGNNCTRVELPTGSTRITSDALIEDTGMPEPVALTAPELAPRELPSEVLQFLLSSRYCDTEVLMSEAWRLFGHLAPGWSRVQAICDYVHQYVTFDYRYARATRTASETYQEKQGVCRDFAHLAIAMCRCMNIPARYCTGYLGDIGVPAVESPMDFAGCMEVYLGGEWHLFDPRNNQRRIGRIIIARGRDAGDVAISTAFGPACLLEFKVWTEEADKEELRRVG